MFCTLSITTHFVSKETFEHFIIYINLLEICKIAFDKAKIIVRNDANTGSILNHN